MRTDYYSPVVSEITIEDLKKAWIKNDINSVYGISYLYSDTDSIKVIKEKNVDKVKQKGFICLHGSGTGYAILIRDREIVTISKGEASSNEKDYTVIRLCSGHSICVKESYPEVVKKVLEIN